MAMTEILSKHYPIYHLSFYVPDVEEAALKHHEMFGSGPFAVMKDITIEPDYKGEPTKVEIAMATGWWGDVAVEFNQQVTDVDYVLRDNGHYGFHHVCIGVDDVPKAIEEFAAHGCPVSAYADRKEYPWAYIDCRDFLGMFIEINPGPDLVWKVAKFWAQDWDKETKVLRYVDDFRATLGEHPEIMKAESKQEKTNYETIFNKWGPDQLSYTVRDLDDAVKEFYEVFGAGPFLKMGPLHYESCTVRGQEADPEIIIALGMWGDMQVEFVQKLNDDPMLFDDDGYGFNHINVVVDDYDEAIAFLKEKGYEPGQEMTSSGKPIAYVDTKCGENIGHYLELHAYNPAIDMCKKAREIWDGKEPYIDLQTVIAAMKG